MISRTTKFNINFAAAFGVFMTMLGVFGSSSQTTAQPPLRPNGKIAFTSSSLLEMTTSQRLTCLGQLEN